MASVPASRIRPLNANAIRHDGRFVLYWMVAYRRVASNFALQRAAELAIETGRPLVVLEPLRVDYRWASDRLHAFVMQGMADQAAAFEGRNVTYLPHVETARGDGRRLFDALAAQAAVIVTDDYPAFFLPRMLAATAARVPIRLEAVDSNGILPMQAATQTFVTAFSFRAHLQRSLRVHLSDWPASIAWDALPAPAALGLPAGLPATPVDVLSAPTRWLASLPIDHAVTPVRERGGATAGTSQLRRFVRERLSLYAEQHGHPDLHGTSGLSPYLHFGHVSSHDVFNAVMSAEGWTSRALGGSGGGRREGWWGVPAGAEAFLDQFITWREVGFNMCATRPDDYNRYDSLPAWARATLAAHADDPRPHLYTPDEFARADTHDAVWNAAQRQLVRDGWMDNYLRMLWGKKILEWSPTPQAALDTMIDVMNRYALDGRDPNSYSGYMWTLGRYDRPWGPERPIFGTIRYMSSDNTVRKLKMKEYLRTYGEHDRLAF